MSKEGYLNHQRGVAFTKNGTKTLAYYVGVESSSVGQQLVIKISEQDGVNFTPKSKFYPLIPYRVMIGDPKILKSLQNSRGFNNQAVGTDLLFNPGVTVEPITGVINGPTSIGINGTSPFVELNLTRGQFPTLNTAFKTLSIWQRQQYYNTGVWIPTDNYSIYAICTHRVDDTRASITASNIDSDTDELCISLTTTVTITGNFYETGATPGLFYTNISARPVVRTLSYSLPVFLRFVIARNSVESLSGDVKPNDWRYLFIVGNIATDSSSYGVSVIKSGLGGTFLTKSWNYSIIPNKRLETTYSSVKYSQCFPLNLGCIADTAYDPIQDKHLGASSVARYNTSISQRDICLNFLSIDSFGTGWANGFVLTSGFANRIPASYTQICNLTVTPKVSVSGVYITASAVNLTSAAVTEGYVNIFGWAGTSVQFSVIIPKATKGVITKLSSSYILTYFTSTSNNQSTYLRSVTLPVDAALSALGIDRAVDLTNVINSPINGFTFFSQSIRGFNYVMPAIMNSIQSSMAQIPNYFFNTLGEDRSIFPTQFNSPTLGMRVSAVSSYIEASLFGSLSSPIETYIMSLNSFNLSAIPEGVAYTDCSGFSTTAFFRAKQIVTSLTLTISSFDTQVLNINGTPSMGYWVNRKFELEPGQGVLATLILSNCSGVFRLGDGSNADWKSTLGGVPVDYRYTRPDLKPLTYGGDYTNFISAPAGWYWAGLSKSMFELSMKYGTKELAVNGGYALGFCDYSVYPTGIFSIHVHTYLDLEDVQDALDRTYTDTDFALSNVAYKVTLKFTDNVIAEGTVDIDPPNPTGEIETTLYKTISDSVNFTMTRADTNTFIRDVSVNVNGNSVSQLPSYTDQNTAVTDTIPVSTTNLKTGDYFGISYRPLYADSRGPDVPVSSKMVTFNKGHKYSLDNVKIYIDAVDKTDEIMNSSSPWLYLNPGAANIAVSVECDINHASYGDEAYPSNLERVYPVIAKTYMMVVPKVYLPPTFIFNSKLEELPPIGAPTTYPNCSYAGAYILYEVYNSATFKDNNVHGGTTIDLVGETLSTLVTADGDYQIYLIVEDEDSQRSAWCITNLKNNFRIPFRRT